MSLAGRVDIDAPDSVSKYFAWYNALMAQFLPEHSLRDLHKATLSSLYLATHLHPETFHQWQRLVHIAAR